MGFGVVSEKTKKTKIGHKMKKQYGLKRGRAVRFLHKNRCLTNVGSFMLLGGSVALMNDLVSNIDLS